MASSGTSRSVFKLLDFCETEFMKDIGLPRSTIQDEVYSGYFIPEGLVYSLITVAILWYS